MPEMILNPEDLAKFVAKMEATVGDMTDHGLVADWAIRFALRSFKDGYQDGAAAVMKMFLMDALANSEEADGIDPRAEFLKRYAGGSGGAPRDGAGPSPEGSTGVSTGQGSETGTGAQPCDSPSGDDLRSAGESLDTSGSGDHQGGGVSGEVRDAT